MVADGNGLYVRVRAGEGKITRTWQFRRTENGGLTGVQDQVKLVGDAVNVVLATNSVKDCTNTADDCRICGSIGQPGHGLRGYPAAGKCRHRYQFGATPPRYQRRPGYSERVTQSVVTDNGQVSDTAEAADRRHNREAALTNVGQKSVSKPPRNALPSDPCIVFGGALYEVPLQRFIAEFNELKRDCLAPVPGQNSVVVAATLRCHDGIF